MVTDLLKRDYPYSMLVLYIFLNYLLRLFLLLSESMLFELLFAGRKLRYVYPFSGDSTNFGEG